MNKFLVKITYKNGEVEEKSLDQNAMSELNQSIIIAEDFYGKIPEKVEILQKE
ncbi:hypothetical protein NEF87_000517 [Candidatus Lokiarchaeum ossiferum]|uniref:Uncharacterized protein n=1 Tax=Candidatus Lokiarchaeum ossiferum TaxID=2951803 RepID=A0ABY6HMW9_9ARCH|nr:hypothetical protein NEF87_000517 [Candidatus Lokiarchaeum sp. B-35]